MQPRWYQEKIITETRSLWAQGAQNVMAVSPPRSGKTLTAAWLSEPFLQNNEHVCFQVHRQELIRQISLEYASLGYSHNILAPNDVVSGIINDQVKKYGKRFIDRSAPMTIASVDTVRSRISDLRQWSSRVRLWMTDEAHHLLADNKWGQVISLFPNAFGLGLTATPIRADNKSLSRAQGGVFDAMVLGPTARDLINEEHICDYRIIAPPSSIDRETIRTGTTGDFTQKGLTDARKKSTITGDCVQTYLKYTSGQQGIAFCVDIDHAHEMKQSFREAGVSAEVISSKTEKSVRKQMMSKFENGNFNILINVDLLGEGLNVGGISVVIMARPTKSFGLYVQQFFRALTKADGKSLATIIDHAGNVGYFGKFYGLPDTYSNWSLASRERGKRSKRDDGVIPVTTCTKCFFPYERIYPKCPHCGHEPVAEGRSKPEQVDGDLVELDQETLAALRGEISRIDSDPKLPVNLEGPAVVAATRQWLKRRNTITDLKKSISIWAGLRRDEGDEDRVIYRKFYFSFGTDIMTAQTLNAEEALKLNERIRATW